MEKLLNKTRNTEVASEVIVAETFSDRLRGLLGRSMLPVGQTMWIKECRSIHTWFMQFAIDAIFVDERLVVRKTYQNLRPWRLILPVWRATSVFEFPAGTLKERPVAIGDQLYVGD